MARGITDFGDGHGYLYVVDKDGVTIKGVYDNDVSGATQVRQIGSYNSPLSMNRAAVGTITVTGCASAGNVTDVTILGVNQIILFACATSVNATLAAQIAAAINAFTPATGYNYTAISVGAVVYIYAPAAAGSSLNGQAITVGKSVGSLTFDTTTFTAGATAGGDYDSLTGVRIFMDADYGPLGITCSVPAIPTSLTYAIEITKYVTMRGLEGGYDTKSITLASDKALSVGRRVAHTLLEVDTEGAAASDNLKYIDTTDFVEGDIIVLRSVATARVVTVLSSTSGTENIFTAAAASFALAGTTNAMVLYYSNDATNGPSFYEVSRTSQASLVPNVTNLRANSIPQPASGSANTVLTNAGGAITYTPGTSKQVQYLSGSATLAAGYTFAGTGTPMDGDEFWIIYRATMTYAGGNTITIFGVVLTADQALSGDVTVYAKYDSTLAAYVATVNNGTSLLNVGDTLTFVVPVSFETGEQCNNDIIIPSKCTITGISANVTKALTATDAGTITAKIAGTGITTGVITIPLSSALGTTVAVVPSAANLATAGQVLTLLTAKTTVGGKALVTVTYTRTK